MNNTYISEAKKNNDTELIQIGDLSYIKGIDENGIDFLKTYDNECKMWIELSFIDETESAKEELIHILSNEYINQMTG